MTTESGVWCRAFHNLGKVVLLIGVVVGVFGSFGVFLCTIDRDATRQEDARSVCYPYVLDTIVKVNGEHIAVCANGERHKLDDG